MALARKHGKNPHLWNDVAPFILRLSQPQYYNDPVVRYGYLRGEETYGYVTSIRERCNATALPSMAARPVPLPPRRARILAEDSKAKY